MMTSPDSNSPANVVMVELVASPAGTITQATRGVGSFAVISSSVVAGSAPNPATASLALSESSKATTSIPCSIRRWVMLAPILPKPTMAIFMIRSSLSSDWSTSDWSTSDWSTSRAQGTRLVGQGLHQLVERLGERGNPFGLECLSHVLHVDAGIGQCRHHLVDSGGVRVDGPGYRAVIEEGRDGGIRQCVDGVGADEGIDVGQVRVGRVLGGSGRPQRALHVGSFGGEGVPALARKALGEQPEGLAGLRHRRPSAQPGEITVLSGHRLDPPVHLGVDSAHEE